MHLNISSVKWQPFCQEGVGGGDWTRIKHAVWPSKCVFNTHVWINLYQFHCDVYTMTLNWISKYNWRNGLVFISSHHMSRRKPIFHMWLRGNNEFKCFGVIGFMKWWQRRGRVGELVTFRKYIWKIYQLSEQWDWVKMDDILCSRPCSFFKELIFVMSLYWILFQTNETVLVKVMTWHITGSKTLREPVITQFTDPCTCMLHFA